MEEGRVRFLMVRNIEIFHFNPPHPAPLPHGERGVPDGSIFERSHLQTEERPQREKNLPEALHIGTF
jgi:hypothetical protein